VIQVGEKPYPWRPEMTVSSLLAELGETEHCAVVRVNDRYITRPNFDRAVIPDGANVYLIPMIAGG
jgi:thiamine biosynthesis protein ThiS